MSSNAAAAFCATLACAAWNLAFAVLRREVPREQGAAFKKRAEEVGAIVRLRDADVRIYPLTPQTEAQLEEIIGLRAGG